MTDAPAPSTETDPSHGETQRTAPANTTPAPHPDSAPQAELDAAAESSKPQLTGNIHEDAKVDAEAAEKLREYKQRAFERYAVRGMLVDFDTGKTKLAAFIADISAETRVATLHVIDTSGFTRPEADVPYGRGHRTWRFPSWMHDSLLDD